MAEKTYSARCLVLRKTKLGEADLIVTMLEESGSCIRAVAKGARKPKSPFSSRLELYSVADVLCARGKNLDIVKEARSVGASAHALYTLEQSSCVAPIAELVSAVAQQDLEHPRLFDMVSTAFDAIASCSSERAPSISAAAVLKTLALSGFRPNFSTCVQCGLDIDLESGGDLRFSALEGGVVCDECASPSDTVRIDAAIIGWCNTLMYSTFADIVSYECPIEAAFACLSLANQFSRVHLGTNMKSLEFLLTSGVFA